MVAYDMSKDDLLARLRRIAQMVEQEPYCIDERLLKS